MAYFQRETLFNSLPLPRTPFTRPSVHVDLTSINICRESLSHRKHNGMCSKATCTLVYSRDESSCIFASVHATSVHRCSMFLAKHLSSRLHGIIF